MCIRDSFLTLRQSGMLPLATPDGYLVIFLEYPFPGAPAVSAEIIAALHAIVGDAGLKTGDTDTAVSYTHLRAHETLR